MKTKISSPAGSGEKSATIGGNISTNAGGMRAVKYGVTRDYVMGLEVVLPDGTITQFGGKVVKNSSGYDLKRSDYWFRGNAWLHYQGDLKASAASEACHQPSDPVPDPETGDRHRPGYHQI